MKRFLISLAALLVVACASDQTKKPETSKASSAEGEPSPVGVIPTTLLHDAQRNKDLDLSIEYPTRGGPFPVIILSHAYGATNRGYESMVANWTGHGYVVIRPLHADAGALREAPRPTSSAPNANPPGGEANRDPNGRDEGGRNRRGQQPPAQTPPPFRPNPADDIWDKEREPQWRDRARDITLVIDSLAGLEDRFPELKGKMDRAKIAVAGHGYGAFTAMLAGGAKTFGNPPLQLGDSRVTAILAMSPPGIAANRGLTAESWREVKVPAMFMTGSRDFGAVETETPEWRKAAYLDSPAGDKYFVLLDGARSSTFTGMAPLMAEGLRPSPTVSIPTVDPRTGQVYDPYPNVQRGNTGTIISERGLFDRIRSIALTFFDAYLKGEAKAKERLKPEGFGTNVTLEVK
jgi:dienelactone hydrolase